MNTHKALICDECNKDIRCLLGFSNKYYQPLTFCCPQCSSPINIDIINFEEIKIKGASQDSSSSRIQIGEDVVYLHLDFPVSLTKYIPAFTPFMMALMNGGGESICAHKIKMDLLNEMEVDMDDITKLIMFYEKNNSKLFRKKVNDFFEVDEDETKNYDDDHLYLTCLKKTMFPFLDICDHDKSINLFTRKMEFVFKKNEEETKNILSFFKDAGFFEEINVKCSKIYQSMLKNECVFRSAIFVASSKKSEEKMSFRTSSSTFFEIKDLYKDISEILNKQLVMIVAIDNICERGSYNKFLRKGKKNIKFIDDFHNLNFGDKLQYVSSSWYPSLSKIANNQLRNSIAHVDASYDEISQLITYYPKKEGVNKKKIKNMSFMDFCVTILKTFREVHKLNILVYIMKKEYERNGDKNI